MKNLLACLAILAAFCANAQTETANFPYNPDSDGDGLIGVSDLVNLLGYYETQFNVSAQLNSDSTSAIFFPADWFSNKKRTNCEAICASLPGPWHIVSSRGFVEHHQVILDSMETSSYRSFWQLDFGAMQVFAGSSSRKLPAHFFEKTTSSSFVFPDVNEYYDSANCLCELRQRPRVEYDFCSGDMGSISTCAAEKVSQGWYPLELTSAGGAVFVQTFWRWED